MCSPLSPIVLWRLQTNSEFIALISDKLQLQLKSAEAAQF